MSRVRKAGILAGFVYAEYAVAIVTGIFLIPMTLHYVGARSWGLWLASGEVLNYAGVVDLGVLGVMPWLFAGADGRRDRGEIQRLLGQALWLGAGFSVMYVCAAAILWRVLPSMLFLGAADRALLAAPLVLVVVLGAVDYPLGAFRTVLVGLQDVVFNGVMTIAAAALGVVITIAMLMSGYGLWALATAGAVPPIVFGVAAFVRVRVCHPDLTPDWRLPRISELRPLLVNGVGAWLGTFGWQILAATNGLVITYMGRPEFVPVYACTAKLSAMCTQLAWVLPDSAQVGLAQLGGEAPGSERLRRVVVMLLTVHLLLAGAAMVGLLAFNPTFVTTWVGPAMFGGLALNALLAVGVVFSSIVHCLMASAAVLGNRLKVGIVAIANGLLQVVLAILLGHRIGLTGVALAVLVAGSVTSVPIGYALLAAATSVRFRALSDTTMRWLVRTAPVAVVAALAGLWYASLGLYACVAIAAACTLTYAWVMRPFYAALPLDSRMTDWLARYRLVPRAQPAPLAVEDV